MTPVVPTVSASSLYIYVRVLLFVKQCPVLHILSEEEVIASDGDIVECGRGFELPLKIFLHVFIDPWSGFVAGKVEFHIGSVGGFWVMISVIDRGKEPYIIEELVVIVRYMHSMVSSHRETRNGSRVLFGDSAIVALDVRHDIGEGFFELSIEPYIAIRPLDFAILQLIVGER